jgi:hypothetical protein
MKDIEYSLRLNNVTEICYHVVNYVCKNKIKDLARFYINQFSSFYITSNIHVIFGMWNRLRRISYIINNSSDKDLKTLFNNRSIRINICELFVILSQINRSVNLIQFRKPRQQIETLEYPNKFTFRSPDGNITIVDDFLSNMNIPYHKVEIFKHLVYICNTSQKKNGICTTINSILNDKDLIYHLEAHHQNIYTILFQLCKSLCVHNRLPLCKILENMFNLYNNSKICDTHRFNLLLMCFDYAFCDEVFLKYECTNKYIKPIVIQTAIKIDYIYSENQKDYPKICLLGNVKDNKKINNIISKKDEKTQMKDIAKADDEIFYKVVLFSTPLICKNRQKPFVTPYRYDRSLSKIVNITELKTNKLKYHIKKNDESFIC